MRLLFSLNKDIFTPKLIFSMQRLSELLNKLEMPLTIEMTQKSRELAAQGHNVISLSLGEPDFDTPDFIKEAAKDGIDNNYSHYMPVPGYVDVREAISRKFKRDNNIEYSPNQIVVSTGAKQSLANVVLSLVDAGDEVIIPAPYWVSYIEQVKIAGGESVVISADMYNDFKITPEQLREAMTEKSRMMIFSSPNNPSGAMYTETELRALAEVIATKKDFYVIADEIYELIAYDVKHFSLASIPEIYDQVITVNGLSKGFAMTGWRLGYIGAPQWIAKACDKMQSQFTSGACSIAQRAALAAVDANPAEVEYMLDQFKSRRDLMLELLNDIPGFKVGVPPGAFYAFVEVSEVLGKSYHGAEVNSSLDLSMYILNVAHVSSVPGEAFGLPNYIRFSYAAKKEDLIEACIRIKDAILKLS